MGRMDGARSRDARKGLAVQYGSAILVSLSSLTVGAWLTWPSTANPLLLKGEACCNATTSELSTMVSLMDLGNILTPIPTSYLCDMYGRKPLIHSTAIMFFVASICSMVADNMWYLYVSRLFAGMAKGIAFAVIPIFLAEVAQVEVRGAMGSIFSFFVSAGISYDYIFGAFLSYQGLNVANIVIPIVFGVGLFFIPESPYYLIMKGDEKGALKNLSKYRHLKPSDTRTIAELEIVRNTVETDMRNKGRFIDVVTTKSRRRALLITSLMACFQRLSGISPLLAYSTITLPENGGGLPRDIYVIIFSFLILLGNHVGIALVDKWGRKVFFLCSSISCCIINVIFALFYTLKWMGTDVAPYNWIPYASLLVFGVAWGIGLSYIPSIIVGELFPTNIKSYACSIQAIMFGVASLAGNALFGKITENYGVQFMFYAFTFSCLLCCLFTIFFMFETKGKTFQEIQIILRELTGDKALNTQQKSKGIEITKNSFTELITSKV